MISTGAALSQPHRHYRTDAVLIGKVRMGSQPPRFVVRQIAEGRWAIDAHWPDKSIEELTGVFVSQIDAERWFRGGTFKREWLRKQSGTR